MSFCILARGGFCWGGGWLGGEGFEAGAPAVVHFGFGGGCGDGAVHRAHHQELAGRVDPHQGGDGFDFVLQADGVDFLAVEVDGIRADDAEFTQAQARERGVENHAAHGHRLFEIDHARPKEFEGLVHGHREIGGDFPHERFVVALVGAKGTVAVAGHGDLPFAGGVHLHGALLLHPADAVAARGVDDGFGALPPHRQFDDLAGLRLFAEGPENRDVGAVE